MPLLVREATVDEEVARCAAWRCLWAKDLALPELLEREARLRAHPWSARARFRVLVLVDADAPDVLLCSCDSYEVDAQLDGTSVIVVLVASLFTEEHLRGRGFAAALVEGVAARAAGLPGCGAVTLYSDIGEAFYRGLGFDIVCGPALDLVLPVDASAAEAAQLSAVVSVTSLDELDESVFNDADIAPGTLVLPVQLLRAAWQVEMEQFGGTLRSRSPLATRGRPRGDLLDSGL